MINCNAPRWGLGGPVLVPSLAGTVTGMSSVTMPRHAVSGVEPHDGTGWHAQLLNGFSPVGEVFRFADGHVEFRFSADHADRRFTEEAARHVPPHAPCRDCPTCESQDDLCGLYGDVDARFAIHLRDIYDWNAIPGLRRTGPPGDWSYNPEGDQWWSTEAQQWINNE